PLVKQAEKVLKITYLEAKVFKSAVIGTEHLLLSILKDENNIASKVLSKHSINYEIIKEELETMLEEKDFPNAEFPGNTADSDDDGAEFGAGGGSGRGSKKADSKSKT